MEQPAAQTPPVRKRSTTAVVISVVVAIAIASAIGVAFYYLTNPQVNTANRATYTGYGFSMQYPSGVQTNTRGVESAQADSGSGQVSWAWNAGKTLLLVTWINASGYNYTAGFKGIVSSLNATYSNVQVTAKGSATLAGTSWQYETVSYNNAGQTEYITYAINFYQAEGRAYVLGYADSSNTTLASLGSWATEFSG